MRNNISFYSDSRVVLSSILMTLTVSVLLTGMGFAQTSSGHYLHPEGIPTGSLAQSYRLGHPGEPEYFQPVQFVLPEQVIVRGARAEGFVGSSQDHQPFFGLLVGQVYRFRITDIPFHSGAELYPTVEIVNRLNPPAGKEWDFPITIEITQEDLELALSGSLVTRVVYLENSYNAVPVETDLSGHRVEIEVRGGDDPIAVAESQGSIMAIVRMGSRLVTEAPNPESPYYFGLPPFVLHE